MIVIDAVADADHTFWVRTKNSADVVLLGVDEWCHSIDTWLVRISRQGGQHRIIVLSQDTKQGSLLPLLSKGIRGYLPKDVSSGHIISVVREVTRDDGRIFISLPMVEICSMISGPTSVLSKREREIMELVAQAMSNAQIARRFSITSGTVKRHLHNIFVKLNAVSRMDAVNKARDASLILSSRAESRVGRPPGSLAVGQACGRGSGGGDAVQLAAKV